jgi:predicted solute-binding protein
VRIALWDIDPFSGSADRLTELGWDPIFTSPADCGRLLLAGEVDVALVPSIELLRSTETFSVLPGTAFASREGFRYVVLRKHRPVQEVRSILCSAETEPFYGLASIVLREQYESRTSLVRSGSADSELVMGRVEEYDSADFLDIGLEWFEMTGTPLSWGFFATRPGTDPNRPLTALQELLGSILREAGNHASENGAIAEADVHPFRAMFDPEVAEGVDELAHYLFYVGILDDIPAIRLMAGQN